MFDYWHHKTVAVEATIFAAAVFVLSIDALIDVMQPFGF